MLAPRAGELWGIELIEEAVADAIADARRNEIQRQFFAGDIRLALPELVERAGRPDVVVVDPPRAGLSQKVVRRIIEASPKRIVYVSCNPTTLAPNAAQLVRPATCCEEVRPVDMFPQTPTSSASRSWSACSLSAMRAVTIRDERRACRGASGPGARRPRVPGAGARGRDQRRGHPAARGPLPGAAGLPQDIPGMELAGEVAGAGRGAERFSVGDRVMAIVGGGGAGRAGDGRTSAC